jgi:hypothetical protein
MTKKVGLWIDRKKAVVVTILEKGVEIKEINSEVEKDLEIYADDRRQSAFTEHLNIYYDAVIDCIRDADSILIFGAGEAKDELRKHFRKDKHLNDRIVDVLTADKMTDHQIAAKVHEYFHTMKNPIKTAQLS